MRRLGVALVAATLAVLCMAPTPGNVGGCGAEITELNSEQFAFDRKDKDCARCTECGISTARCVRACDPTKPPDTSVPSTCRPVSHDGEVCLDALTEASCESYATYVADTAPATPSECEFCQYLPPGPLPGFAVPDAGPDAEGGTL